MLGRIPGCCMHPQTQQENACADEKCRGMEEGEGCGNFSEVSYFSAQ